MGAVAMVARARMRRRRAATVALIGLVGIAGGVFVASLAGARRTASSLNRFEASTRTATFEIDTGSPSRQQLAEFARTPGITGIGRLRQVALFNADLGFLPVAAPIDGSFGRAVDRARLVSGRDARAVDELVVGEGLVDRFGFGVGDRLTFASFTQAQIDSGALEQGVFDPRGPEVTFRIVGIVRRPLDLGARGEAGGVIVPTRAFLDRYRDEIGSFSGTILRVRTAHGAADGARIGAAARRVFGDSPQFTMQAVGIEGSGAASAIDVTAAGLWVLAAITAFAGLVAVGLALARSMTVDADDQPVLRALGLRVRQRWSATAGSSLPVALGGGLLAVVVAVLASPLFPIGVARRAEPHSGFAIDAVALGGGLAIVVVAVLVSGGVSAWSVTRRRERTAPRQARASRAAVVGSLPPTVTVGVGFAFERGRGRRAVPVWSTLVAVAMGAVGVVAALVFGASLHALTSDPAAYGWTWDVADFGAVHVDDPCPEGLDAHGAAAVASLCYRGAAVEGRQANVWTLAAGRGRIDAPVVAGRAPTRPDEAAVGQDLLDASGKAVGDRIRIAGEGHAVAFRVVGRAVVPRLDDPQPLAGSALVTPGGMQRLGGAFDSYAVYRATTAAAVDPLVARLDRLDGAATPIGARVPVEIERLQQIDRVPALLAALTALVALAAIAFTLVVSIHRRGRDLAILKTIGFGRRQIRSVVAWQATTLGAVGAGVGLVLGLVVGRAVWSAVATALGVGTDVTVPVAAVAVVVPLALVLLNVVAAFPARAAARIPAAVLLRSE